MIITQTQTESALIKREDAAKYLGVSDRWMQRYKVHGITAVKLGKFVYILKADLDKYIAQNRIEADAS